MIYRCRVCQYKEGRGILPGVVCGLFLFAQMGIAAGAIAFLLPKEFFTSFGWWKWFALPLLPVIAFFGALLLNYFLEALEWFVFCRRKCPQCGKRRWSWGFRRGLGL